MLTKQHKGITLSSTIKLIACALYSAVGDSSRWLARTDV